MPTNREQFEVWAIANGYRIHRDKHRRERYDSYATQDAWQGWFASRKAALEEAAKVAEETPTVVSIDAHSVYEHAKMIAILIRRLSGEGA
jgi:hypothetical protein